MLPFEILLCSIGIGVDRVGSRLPLQGRCALVKVGFGSLHLQLDKEREGTDS